MNTNMILNIANGITIMLACRKNVFEPSHIEFTNRPTITKTSIKYFIVHLAKYNPNLISLKFMIKSN